MLKTGIKLAKFSLTRKYYLVCLGNCLAVYKISFSQVTVPKEVQMSLPGSQTNPVKFHLVLFYYLSINFALPSEYLSPAGLIFEEAVSIS